MTLLDAYALIAFLTAGPATPQVRALLREGDTVVTTANLVEVLDVSQRVRGIPIARVQEMLEPLFEGPLKTLALDLEIAQTAAAVRAEHYHRSSCPLSLADAVLIASAGPGDRIATADPPVLNVARLRELDVLALAGES